MPITLTTPIQTGALDPNGPYAEVKISQFLLDTVDKCIWITCQYGNTDEGVWIPSIKAGLVVDRSYCIRDEGEDTDYTDMVTAESAAAEEVYYDKVKTILYQWLLDKGHYVGTIT
jgi:hypothetical protein